MGIPKSDFKEYFMKDLDDFITGGEKISDYISKIRHYTRKYQKKVKEKNKIIDKKRKNCGCLSPKKSPNRKNIDITNSEVLENKNKSASVKNDKNSKFFENNEEDKKLPQKIIDNKEDKDDFLSEASDNCIDDKLIAEFNNTNISMILQKEFDYKPIAIKQDNDEKNGKVIKDFIVADRQFEISLFNDDILNEFCGIKSK